MSHTSQVIDSMRYLWTTHPGNPEELTHSRSKVKLRYFVAFGFAIRVK
jgi:hypothetical protein